MIGRRGVLAGASALAATAVIGRAVADDVSSSGMGKAALGRAAKKAKAFLDAHGAPGISMAYARDGKVRYAGAFGLADPRKSAALRINQRFRIASVSKPITSVAIWKLVESGKLSVGHKVFGADGALPKYALKAAPKRDWLEAITIDHLLTHTAGGWTNDGADPMFKDGSLSHGQLIQMTLDKAALKTKPGTAYAYSNFGYCLLGRIIEAVTGQSYERAVRQLVLAPSGAGTMVIGGNTLEDRRPDEVFYQDAGGIAYGMNIRRMDSHGGWLATPTELLDFVHHVDGYKSVPDILKAATIGKMVAPSQASTGYARGWAINPKHGNRWHAGSLPGSVSLLVRVEGGGHFAGLVNTRTTNPDLNDALDGLMWAIYEDVNA